MKLNYPWLPLVLFETPNEGGTGGATVPGTAGNDTVAAGDPPPSGDDTASGDIISDNDSAPSGDDTTDGDLISDDDNKDPSGFNSDEISFTEETIVEDVKDLLPEDFEVDPKGMNEFLTAMNAATSRADMIKSALDIFGKYQADSIQQQADAWAETQKNWKAETRAHPEYGGSKLAESAANAKLVAKTYGGKEFMQLLQVTGTSNHPAMMVFLNKLHEALPTEGEPIGGQPTTGEKSLADRLFGG